MIKILVDESSSVYFKSITDANNGTSAASKIPIPRPRIKWGIISHTTDTAFGIYIHNFIINKNLNKHNYNIVSKAYQKTRNSNHKK